MARPQRVLLLVCLLAAAALGAWWGSHRVAPAPAAVALAHGTLLAPTRDVGPLDLVDQAGSPFTQARFNGHWSVVYFGFTSCPMICPTTMAMLKDVARDLAPLPANAQPQIIFITVDPDTDTPEVIGRYVASFDPAFLGLTGTKASLEAAARQFSVAYDRSGAGGSIDHSSTIYAVDPHGALRAVFTPPQTASGIADDYRRLAGRLAGPPESSAPGS